MNLNLSPVVVLNDVFRTTIRWTDIQALATTYQVQGKDMFSNEEDGGGALRFNMVSGTQVEAYYDDPRDAEADRLNLLLIMQGSPIAVSAEVVRDFLRSQRGDEAAPPLEAAAPQLKITDDVSDA